MRWKPATRFHAHGANLVRVRLWNDARWTRYSDLSDVKKTIARARAQGMQVLLDLHYSDDWADGEKQLIAKAWAGITDTDELARTLYGFTYDTLSALDRADLMPALVQVGNESTSDLRDSKPWDKKRPIDRQRNAKLFNAGIKAVHDISARSAIKPRVMLHIAQPENVEPWFAAATKGRQQQEDAAMTGINRRELLRGMLASGVSAALTVGAAGAFAPLGDATLAPRERLLFDFGWRFHLGHASDPSRDFAFGTFQRTSAKAGKDTATAAQLAFDDSAWELLDLPHDRAVTLPFRQEPISATITEDAPAAAHGYKPLGKSFPEHSVGWYRRTRQIPASDLGKRISLLFDGVFRDCIVFCNGHVVGRNASGYCGFEFDLSEVLDDGKPNLIAVRVDAALGEGWFYEGAGIYRHMWLHKTDRLHLPQDGVFVRSTLQGSNATAQLTTEVRNDGSAPRHYNVQARVTAPDGRVPDGRVVAQAVSAAVTVAPGQVHVVEQTVPLGQAALWSIDTQQLYSLTTSVHSDGAAIDTVLIAFGVRSIAFDAQRGFLLNGAPLKLHGTNNHQDHAGVGTAIPDSLHEWRLRQLKSMGCNAYRSAHNPATPELLAWCDRLGMLVIEETRRMSTDPEAVGELETMVRRGRNHPSVILWSLGNEEPQQVTERGARSVGRMQQHVRQLDPTRPNTFAMDKGFGDGVGQVVDVVGFNYRTSQMDGFHAHYPSIPIYASETGSTVSVRGNYQRDDARGYTRA